MLLTQRYELSALSPFIMPTSSPSRARDFSSRLGDTNSINSRSCSELLHKLVFGLTRVFGGEVVRLGFGVGGSLRSVIFKSAHYVISRISLCAAAYTCSQKE